MKTLRLLTDERAPAPLLSARPRPPAHRIDCDFCDRIDLFVRTRFDHRRSSREAGLLWIAASPRGTLYGKSQDRGSWQAVDRDTARRSARDDTRRRFRPVPLPCKVFGRKRAALGLFEPFTGRPFRASICCAARGILNNALGRPQPRQFTAQSPPSHRAVTAQSPPRNEG